MVDIDHIMTMLDSNNRDEVQAEGMEHAKNIRSINVFLQPVSPGIHKNVWENCAKILASKSDQELQPYLLHLLLWLEDLNWPGASILMARLNHFSGRSLCPEFTRAVYLARMDLPGGEWLDYLSGLLENKELRMCLTPDVLDLLCDRYDDFWGNRDDSFR